MDLPQIQLLINIQKDQTALIYTLWNTFQGLALILTGYVFSQEFVRKNPLILACFSTSIGLYAVGNHNAIIRAQDLVAAATTQLNEAAVQFQLLSPVLSTFKAPHTETLAYAHIVFTIFVAAGIWVPFAVAKFSRKSTSR